MLDHDNFVDAICETYPQGMAEADVVMELAAHGVSPITAKYKGRDIYRNCLTAGSERVDSAWCAIEMYSVLYEYDRKGRLAEMLEKLGNCKVARFADNFWTLIVHPSTRRPGKWQLSRLDSHGPWGHSDHDSFERAVAAAIGAGDDRMFDEGSSKFKLVDKAGEREVACHSNGHSADRTMACLT